MAENSQQMQGADLEELLRVLDDLGIIGIARKLAEWKICAHAVLEGSGSVFVQVRNDASIGSPRPPKDLDFGITAIRELPDSVPEDLRGIRIETAPRILFKALRSSGIKAAGKLSVARVSSRTVPQKDVKRRFASGEKSPLEFNPCIELVTESDSHGLILELRSIQAIVRGKSERLERDLVLSRQPDVTDFDYKFDEPPSADDIQRQKKEREAHIEKGREDLAFLSRIKPEHLRLTGTICIRLQS